MELLQCMLSFPESEMHDHFFSTTATLLQYSRRFSPYCLNWDKTHNHTTGSQLHHLFVSLHTSGNQATLALYLPIGMIIWSPGNNTLPYFVHVTIYYPAHNMPPSIRVQHWAHLRFSLNFLHLLLPYIGFSSWGTVCEQPTSELFVMFSTGVHVKF